MRIFLLALLIAGCVHVPPPRPIDGAATCADACNRGADLGCEFAKPTPQGSSCEEVCTLGIDSQLFTFDLECRAKAPSCSAAEACERAKPPGLGLGSGVNGARGGGD